jgi:hypothetical protein
VLLSVNPDATKFDARPRRFSVDFNGFDLFDDVESADDSAECRVLTIKC